MDNAIPREAGQGIDPDRRTLPSLRMKSGQIKIHGKQRKENGNIVLKQLFTLWIAICLGIHHHKEGKTPMSSVAIETGLSSEAHNIPRALASLQEELEAIDYYHQRVDVSDDESLKSVLAHNRGDEMEHATMLMEGLRRAMPGFDLQMRKFMFSPGSLTALAAGKAASQPQRTGLGLGSLQGKENKERS
jgi:hypothetical protein